MGQQMETQSLVLSAYNLSHRQSNGFIETYDRFNDH